MWSCKWFLVGKGPISVSRFRSELLDHYGSRRRENPGVDITEVNNITIGMLGKHDGRELKLKARETRDVLPFVLHCLRRYGHTLPNRLSTGQT